MAETYLKTLRAQLKEPLSELVKGERRLKGWSQKRLAERSGISVCTIIRIEKAQIEPERNTLECVLGALGWELVFEARRKQGVKIET
jgi:transcriptional regulator with XRE-family HTH domain